MKTVEKLERKIGWKSRTATKIFIKLIQPTISFRFKTETKNFSPAFLHHPVWCVKSYSNAFLYTDEGWIIAGGKKGEN